MRGSKLKGSTTFAFSIGKEVATTLGRKMLSLCATVVSLDLASVEYFLVGNSPAASAIVLG